VAVGPKISQKRQPNSKKKPKNEYRQHKGGKTIKTIVLSPKPKYENDKYLVDNYPYKVHLSFTENESYKIWKNW